MDRFVVEQMQRRNIPGLSLCVIDEGRIIKSRAYGVVEAGSATPVTPSTLFLAGSLSKSVTSAASLVLVDRGKLTLDGDVNAHLDSWKVPANDFTRKEKVTLRRILSHSAGLTVETFAGYPTTESLPSLVQVLDGQPPAKNQPVRVDVIPGTKYRYSSGGYVVAQQLLMDVANMPFSALMQKIVLGPLQMKDSTFSQPLPASRTAHAATGYTNNRTKVPGRWHVYPEMASGGLWTTAADYCRFVLGIQRSVHGTRDGLLSRAMAHEMVTRQKERAGLGLFLDAHGASTQFWHFGRDEGFDSVMRGYVGTGKGAVLLFNANDNSRMMYRIYGKIAEIYDWPDHHRLPKRNAPVDVAPETLISYAGQYEFRPGETVAFAARDDQLFKQVDSLDDEAFIPESERRFISADRDVEVTFQRGPDGTVTGLVWVWKNDGKKESARRVTQ